MQNILSKPILTIILTFLLLSLACTVLAAPDRPVLPTDAALQILDAQLDTTTPNTLAEWPGAPCVSNADCGTLQCCNKVCAESCRDASTTLGLAAPRSCPR